MSVFNVQSCGSGETLRCHQQQSLVEAQLGAGSRMITYACRGGGCGRCKLRVRSGKYRLGKISRAHVSEQELEQGWVLGCKTYPDSDLLIEC